MVNYSFSIPQRHIFTLIPGKYKFEVWGAQGGIAESQSYVCYPGNGGYSAGFIKIFKETDIFVYVGGKGMSKGVGGFNGGGNVSNTASTAGGGGASDIRIGVDDLHARVIVAGGGGGLEHSYADSYAGAGGGIEGETGFQLNRNNCGTGGTQTEPGTHKGTGKKPGFGYGGNSLISSTGAGGGGWYGGGASHADIGEGSGGSGYVFTSETYDFYPDPLISKRYFLYNAVTITGNTTFLAPNGTTEKGHSGDGFVRITLVRAIACSVKIRKQNNLAFLLLITFAC